MRIGCAIVPLCCKGLPLGFVGLGFQGLEMSKFEPLQFLNSAVLDIVSSFFEMESESQDRWALSTEWKRRHDTSESLVQCFRQILVATRLKWP